MEKTEKASSAMLQAAILMMHVIRQPPKKTVAITNQATAKTRPTGSSSTEHEEKGLTAIRPMQFILPAEYVLSRKTL
jgi:hypothetical protein